MTDRHAAPLPLPRPSDVPQLVIERGIGGGSSEKPVPPPDMEHHYRRGQQIARRSRRRRAIWLKIYSVRARIGTWILPFNPHDPDVF